MNELVIDNNGHTLTDMVYNPHPGSASPYNAGPAVIPYPAGTSDRTYPLPGPFDVVSMDEKIKTVLFTMHPLIGYVQHKISKAIGQQVSLYCIHKMEEGIKHTLTLVGECEDKMFKVISVNKNNPEMGNMQSNDYIAQELALDLITSLMTSGLIQMVCQELNLNLNDYDF